VTGIKSARGADGSFATYVRVHPERIIKGLSATEFTLREPGGRAASVRRQPTVRFGRAWQGPGNRSRLPLLVESAPFTALYVELRYDPTELRAAGVRRLATAAGALVQSNAGVPGVVKIAMASATPIPGDGSTVLAVQFVTRTTASARSALHSVHIVDAD